jgi:regulation of enolase protein 1 (concanavalin A-like superfamily)
MNEPEKWEVKDGNLSMYVTPQSDYWRVTYHDFIVDDGPFYYTTRGGEFEVSVKIQGEYKSKYDQMGLMLRIDEEHWVKTGIEYVDGIYNFSTVVTDQHSSWSVYSLMKNLRQYGLRPLDVKMPLRFIIRWMEKIIN